MSECSVCVEEGVGAGTGDRKLAAYALLALFIVVAVSLNLYTIRDRGMIVEYGDREEPSVLLGLIDGLNLCNLSLTIFLVSLAYTSGVPRSRMLLLATAFLGSQAAMYFAIGTGILGTLKALTLASSVPRYLITRIAASAMLVLGGVMLANSIWPGALWTPRPLAWLSERMRRHLYSLGLLGAGLGGALVALHSIPCACTGGVYITFLSMIVESEAVAPKIAGYVILYILPPLAILALSLNRHTYGYIAGLLSKGRAYKAVLGALISVLAATLLLIIYIINHIDFCGVNTAPIQQ